MRIKINIVALLSGICFSLAPVLVRAQEPSQDMPQMQQQQQTDTNSQDKQQNAPPKQEQNALPQSQPEGAAAQPQEAAPQEGASPKQGNASPDSKEERITLDLRGVDINELFRMLSLRSGFTIITTPEVQGRASVFMNNLTFEEALNVVIAMQNLAYEKKESVIKVMTAAEYERLYGKKFDERKVTKTIKLAYAKPANIVNMLSSLKSDMGKIIVDETTGTLLLIDSPPAMELMEKTIKELDQPLETAVFDINYAKSADVKKYLDEMITPGLGQVIMDERSNKAIVSDLPQRLVRIKSLMKEFDEASRQVLITADIVQVTLTNKFQRGIDWEGIFSGKNMRSFDVTGKYPADSTLSSYQKINVGTLSRDDYTAAFNMLKEYGDVQTLSRPQVVALNNEEAHIMVGSREAYVSQTQSQSESSTVTSEAVEFIDVGVKLKVVPTINKEGFITMKIKPEISSVSDTLLTKLGSKIPIVSTSEAETVVKVKDGSTVMITGLMKQQDSDTIKGIPVASKIPFAGAFFGNRTKDRPKTELVVFLTPTLVSGDVSVKREEKNAN